MSRLEDLEEKPLIIHMPPTIIRSVHPYADHPDIENPRALLQLAGASFLGALGSYYLPNLLSEIPVTKKFRKGFQELKRKRGFVENLPNKKAHVFGSSPKLLSSPSAPPILTASGRIDKSREYARSSTRDMPGRKTRKRSAKAYRPRSYSKKRYSGAKRKRAISSRGRGRRASTKRGRRSTGRSVKRGRGSGLTAKRILGVLARVNTFCGEIGDLFYMPTSDATRGMPAAYFCVNGQSFTQAIGQVADPFPNTVATQAGATVISADQLVRAPTPFGSGNAAAMTNVAYQIDSSNHVGDIKFYQVGFKIVHNLTNGSNRDLTITVYKVKARDHIPLTLGLTPLNTLRQEGYSLDPLNAMGRGFASMNMNSGVPTHSNTGMAEAEITPYMSPTFCHYYKIVSQKTGTLPPGKCFRVGLRDKRQRGVNTIDLVTTPSVATAFHQRFQHTLFRRGETFYMFKVEPCSLGVDSVSHNLLASSQAAIAMHTQWEYKWKRVEIISPIVVRDTKFIATGGTVNRIENHDIHVGPEVMT